jgi:CheY-like chemotaxis protein
VEDGEEGPSSFPPSPSSRILMVDDNEDAAECLAMMLRAGGHEVRTANDGPAAFDSAKQHRLEVVLLDIGLPRMDGYEVARRLREQAGMRDVVVVAVAGYGEEEDRGRAMEAGFDAHLTKAADLATFQQLLADFARSD